jgi:hypothetical protein
MYRHYRKYIHVFIHLKNKIEISLHRNEKESGTTKFPKKEVYFSLKSTLYMYTLALKKDYFLSTKVCIYVYV